MSMLRVARSVSVSLPALLSACSEPAATGDGGSGTASDTSGSGDEVGSSAGSSGGVDSGSAATVDVDTSASVDETAGATSAGEVDSEGGGCGGGPACAEPFVCADGGYCASATGVPQFGNVYVVVFENRSLDSVMGHAPYLDSLAAIGAYATAFNSITHPSLPNYIAMTSGDIWGIGCDCHPGPEPTCDALSCNLILSSCDCPNDVEHLGDQLDGIGVTWREYGEGMGEPCNITDSSADHYAAKHLPFLYYTNVLGNAARCEEHVRDYTDFAADLAAETYRYSYISPDLCNDMHDTCGGDPIAHGDAWAAENLAPILAKPGFQADGHDVLFIVWDEQDNSIGNAPIPFIVVSPLVEPGSVTALPYDHYSLLATWEDGFGLARLGHAAEAEPIADIWK
jgi:hypothetical protein